MSSEADTVISVRGLGKRYEIYERPRDRLLQMLSRGRRQYFREFWALRNISFDVRRGETMAIIGRNGSGKSTLLQLICGTLNPTEGEVTVNGRVAALLELGAGFNPEFTGRENVYMAASLLGLRREQIDERFDRIAAFADIGQFMDQPVKTYSSGMYVRLAFSVNAHVDADILVIDEALAVGDAVFTQRCMRFIRGFQKRGTLLFVSHDAAAVQNLCRSALWIAAGQVQKAGDSRSVCEAYLQYTLQETYGDEAVLQEVVRGPAVSDAAPAQEASARVAIDYGAAAIPIENVEGAGGFKTGDAEILGVTLRSLAPDGARALRGGEKVELTVRARAHKTLERPILGFLVKDRLGQELFGENTLPCTDVRPVSVAAGRDFSARFVFELPMLPNGNYSVTASVADGDLYNHVHHNWLHDALIIQVASAKVRFGIVGLSFDEVSMEVLS